MKRGLFLLVGMLAFLVISVSAYVSEYASTAVCSSCGTVLMGAQLLSAVRSSSGGKLFCTACMKRMKGRKEGTATSPQSAQKGGSPVTFIFSDGAFSPASPRPLSPAPAPSPVSPLMVPAYRRDAARGLPTQRSASAPLADRPITAENAAVLGAFLAARRKEKDPNAFSERDVFISEPTTTKDFNMIALFELLYAKRVPATASSKQEYSCEFHYGTRIVDFTAPDGKHSSFEMSKKRVPFVWKQVGGSVLLYTNEDGITVRDLETNYVHHFPLDVMPYGALKTLGSELGITRVESLPAYEEARRAYEAALAELPSPSFK